MRKRESKSSKKKKCPYYNEFTNKHKRCQFPNAVWTEIK